MWRWVSAVSQTAEAFSDVPVKFRLQIGSTVPFIDFVRVTHVSEKRQLDTNWAWESCGLLDNDVQLLEKVHHYSPVVEIFRPQRTCQPFNKYTLCIIIIIVINIFNVA